MIHPKPLARNTDPHTSHEAGEAIRPHLGQLQEYVLNLLLKTPNLTGNELAQAHGEPDPRKINRRLPELERDGLAVRGQARACRVTGRLAHEWRAASDSEQKTKVPAPAAPAEAQTPPERAGPRTLFDISPRPVYAHEVGQ